VSLVGELLSRRRARRWQRWSEVEPEDDYLRWARAGTVIATAFLLIVLAGIVVALVAR
jgi:hypothetical protein